MLCITEYRGIGEADTGQVARGKCLYREKVSSILGSVLAIDHTKIFDFLGDMDILHLTSADAGCRIF